MEEEMVANESLTLYGEIFITGDSYSFFRGAVCVVKWKKGLGRRYPKSEDKSDTTIGRVHQQQRRYGAGL